MSHRIRSFNRPLFSTTFVAVVLGALLSGCELSSAPDDIPASDLIVANGGNFSDQNGFLSTVALEDGEVVHGTDLGGFVQGLVPEGDQVHVLLNTFSQGRVEVFTHTSSGLVRTAQWTGLAAPRDMAFTADSAWVSNFVFGGPGMLTPVHRATGSAGPSIPVGEAPEGVLIVDDVLFVANNGSLGAGSTLTRVRLTGRVVSEVAVPCDGPRDLARRGSSELVVVCTGKTVYNDDFSAILAQTPGKILFVESGTGSVVRVLDLDVQAGNANGSRAIHVSERTSELFVTLSDGSIQVVDLAARSLGDRIIPAEDPDVIGLAGVAYNADEDAIYVGRLARSGSGPFPDYTTSGQVHSIGRDGSIRARWTVGPAPTALVLR
jgi:DNA-binding beta-propeller fold protein YncE